MSGTQIGELAAIGTALLWTLSSLAWTSAGKSVGILSVSFIRLIITCPMLLAYGRLVRGLWLPSDASGEAWLILTISGFVGFFLTDLCLFKSFMLLGPRLALLVFSLAPPFTAIVSWPVLGEPLAMNQWIGMAVTLAGVAWVVLEEPETDPHPKRQRPLARGVTLAAVAAAGQAVGMVLSKRGMGDYDPAASSFIRILGGMAGYVVLVTIWQRWPSIVSATRDRRAMAIVTFGAIVGPFVGVVLSMIALHDCHPGVVTTILSTMPVLILPFVIVLYGERVSPRAIGGAVLSVLGVAILMLPLAGP
jgi:drug/metabolite transporter (DMT)-like permease